MTEQHPITPPPKLVQEWCLLSLSEEELLVIAAQWGADQELEACCEWMRDKHWIESELVDDLRAARRPKPPSLKEQALADFKWLIGRTVGNPEADARSERILQALESLSDD